MNSLENLILAYLENNPARSSKDVFDGLNATKGYATVKQLQSNPWHFTLSRIVQSGRNEQTSIAPKTI